MILYNNGCFSLGSVSFQLPNNVFLDTADDEVVAEGFCLYSLDESFNMRIRFCQSEIGAYEGLARMLCSSETGYTLLEEITKVNVNGLTGYKAAYEDKISINEEYAFDLADCGDYNLLSIYTTIDKRCKAFDEVFKNRMTSEVLQSIEVK